MCWLNVKFANVNDPLIYMQPVCIMSHLHLSYF